MKSFCEFLEERALNIGDKSASYPKFGNILILSGGSGSGKSFASDRIINFEGKRFDVDAVKTSLLKWSPDTLAKKFTEQTGRYLESINLGDPADASIMHQFIADNKIADKAMTGFFLAQAGNLRHKPNVIMDVTLKDTNKLKEISRLAKLGGYDRKKIHIVWIINDFNVAISQNQQRSRTVSSEIMFKTHIGAAKTMKELIANTTEYRNYADGDIWALFNKGNVDNKFSTGETSFVVDFYTAIRLKKAGQPADYESIEQKIIDKINSYIPDDAQWTNESVMDDPGASRGFSLKNNSEKTSQIMDDPGSFRQYSVLK